MKQVSGLISTYSSDEFGICSALFELGGMVVMHDASGCNSTYTTHDEPRWYDMDSMIFISAISESEAIMGDDDKFIGDLIETAENKLNDTQKKEFYPKAFALMQENMERLQKEVAWFVEKNDYRNKDKDWGNSADSIQRGMQKCAGGYPADEVFRAKL